MANTGRVSKQQLSVAALAMVLVVLTLLFTSRLRELEVYPLPILRLGAPGDISSPPRYDISSRNCTTFSQWVVTTSNAKTPSIAVQVLLDSTNDWCVLVLGEAEGLGYDSVPVDKRYKESYILTV